MWTLTWITKLHFLRKILVLQRIINEKINILIKEIQQLSSRVIKLEFEDDHEKKSIGGTTDE